MSNIIRRTDAVDMDTIIKEYIREMQLAAGLDNQLVCEAWNKVSGAGNYTLGCRFSKGKLYVSVSTSVVRSRLFLRKKAILDEMNGILSGNSMFSGSKDGMPPVTDIILK